MLVMAKPILIECRGRWHGEKESTGECFRMALPCSFSQMRLKQRRKWFHLKCIALGSNNSLLSRVILRFRIRFWFFFFRVILRQQIFFFEATETVHGQSCLSLFLGIKTCPGKKHSKGSERSTKASKVELAMLSTSSVIWGMGGQHTQDKVCLLLWHHAQPLINSGYFSSMRWLQRV